MPALLSGNKSIAPMYITFSCKFRPFMNKRAEKAYEYVKILYIQKFFPFFCQRSRGFKGLYSYM